MKSGLHRLGGCPLPYGRGSWGVVSLLALAQIGVAQVRLPSYSRDTLPNGAVLLMMPRPGVPLVHFRVVIRGGAEAEPSALAGISAVTAALLRRGTATRTADQFSTELEFLGGSFEAVSDNSSTAINAEFLKKDIDRGIELLSDALLHASFPEQETARELARRVDAARAAKDNAQASIGSYTRAAFYGKDHPYGHPAGEATLARIQRKDITDFYSRIFAPRNMIIALTGDFDAAAARAKIIEAFGRTAAGTTYSWVTAPALARRGKLVLVDKPDATQTYFQIAQPGIDRKSPDRVKLDIVNTLFGGRFTSMLNDELRVNSGLTYGANSAVERSRLPGAITISTYTKTETTVQAIDLALELLKRLDEKGITAEQLASAKAYVKGIFPTTRLETIDQLANVMTEIELYGLERAEIDEYFAKIDGVTLEEANATARKYYRSEALTMVLVGPAEKIRDAVRKYDANLTVIPITAPGFGQ
jgi:zinc protease